MKKHYLMLAATIMLLAGTSGTRAEDTIRFATEGAYPPFNERAADGSLIGFEIDLGMAMCDKIKRKCEFLAQDWDGMIPGLLANKFDGIFASMAITEERKKKIDFTNKYYQTGGVFVARKGTKLDTADKALGGKVIGTIPGVTQCYLEKAFPDATVRVYETADSLYLDLDSGRVDAILSDAIGVDFGLLKTERGKDMEFASEIFTDRECFGEGVGIGIRKDDTGLRDEFNKAIVELRADGTYDTIMKKYFQYDIYGK
ncbi:MAG TPA: transporter substrate-binding domain-containing protein [Nordella sp.]|nr:transporter substrate-binding domain-containing protein [Nordella sp.]